MCENKSFHCHAAPWWEGKKSLTIFFFLLHPDWRTWAGLQNSWSLHRTNSKWAQKKGSVMWFPQHWAVTNPCEPTLLCARFAPREQAPNLCSGDFLKAKHRVPPNPQHSPEKTCWLRDFISHNQSLQCPPVYFHTKNYRNILLPSSWFLKQCSWVFHIFNSL